MHFFHFASLFFCIFYIGASLDESLPGHETQGKSYAAGSTGHSTTHTRYRTLTAVFGPDDEQEEEMNRYGDKMKDSVEAELTEQAMIDAGIEPEDVSDLKVSEQLCIVELWTGISFARVW